MSDQMFDRSAPLQPFSQEAEEAMLGAAIVNPNSFFATADFLSADDFFLLRHRWIWEAMVRITRRGDEYDYLTVSQELESMGHLKDIGGMPYLLQLVNNTPSSAMGEAYAKVVSRLATRRRLLTFAEEVRELALDQDLSVEDIAQRSEKSMLSAFGQAQDRSVVSLRDAVSEVFETTEQAIKDDRLLMGLPTGFHALDELLNGLNKERFVIVAGRPGMGKSAFLLNVALNVARQGKRVFYWTGEMSATDNAIRLMSGETGIKSKDIQSGNLDMNEWKLFVEATGRLADLPLWIDPTPGITPQQLKARLIRQQILHGIDLVIVDYLQLMTSHGENRVQEVARISQALKGFSKTFNIPVLAAAQLSRELERRPDKRPILSDLKESGSLEQDADVVMFIYRDEVYNPETEYPNQAEIIVAKHRQGPTDTISLYWDKRVTRFLNGKSNQVNLGGSREPVR